ncbi:MULTISPECIES: hypothetical protein [Moorena]|uniref:hypothetical protein n=1 Tax=Moorena TaxID=1155738 RepID=UPI0013018293|nr:MULTISPECIES: hypothetical protein [Moorena]NEO24639.1 hypothetical protein [Moorena sp. SIO4A5]NEQ79606.1 hypothetical protein [Moorena sp. SIO2I5]
MPSLMVKVAVWVTWVSTCLDAVADGGNPLWRRCLPLTALAPFDRAASLLPTPYCH